MTCDAPGCIESYSIVLHQAMATGGVRRQLPISLAACLSREATAGKPSRYSRCMRARGCAHPTLQEFKSSYKYFVDISEYDGPSASSSQSYLAIIGAPAPPESGCNEEDSQPQLKVCGSWTWYACDFSDFDSPEKAVDFLVNEGLELLGDDLWFADDFSPTPSANVATKCSSDTHDIPTRAAGKENAAVPMTAQEMSSYSVEGNLSSPSREAEAERPTTPAPARHRRGLLRASLQPTLPSLPSGSSCSSLSPICATPSTSTSTTAPPVATPGLSTSTSPTRAPSQSDFATADAGPSRLVFEASDDAKILPALPAEPTLRRSKRKRSEPQAYADAPALPPVKKAKSVKGAVAKGGKNTPQGPKKRTTKRGVAHETAVAGPSNHGQATGATPEHTEDDVEDQSLPEAQAAEEHTQRPRRTGEEVKEDTVLNIPDHACTVVGCQLRWDPYRHEDNRTHLRKHFDVAQLQSKAGLACFFTGCIKTPPGTKLLGHIEEDHLTLPYLCPVRCGWRSSRSGYQGQHMRKTHHVMDWKR